ncbi:MAG: hypothetical protein LQ346_003197 [Caloplaca aetnensis]|nr:MAG: hypothetical protein LQ346_003197 [Caloplaca aetnensis]
MEKLPPELILEIAYYLEAFDIVKLHLVSRRLRDTTRDSKLWKRRCFEDSNAAATQRRRDLQFIAPSLARETARVFELQRRARALTVRETAIARCPDHEELAATRALANWDPSYASERIDWYEEYIARHAPISMCRLQQPADSRGWNRETRGLGRYVKNNKSLIVAPLDDDSVCVWEAGQEDDPTDRAAGAIVGRSNSCSMTTKLAGEFSKTANRARINIAEGVSVDSAQNKAYIAVHNILTEVDLETLRISSSEEYPSPISALSEASHPTLAEPAVPYKNRSSASSSKLLSVIPHGTRIVFSDSDGGLKWVERDGHTLVRRWNLNAYNASTVPAPDPAASQMFASHDGGSVARKILPLGSWEEPKGELAVWTGEKIGILGFRPKPRFEWEWDQREVVGTEEGEFRTMMRRALERDADNARIVRGLGLGR